MASCNKKRPAKHSLTLRGRFTVEHVRGGKIIGTYDVPNGITNAGRNALLDIMFHGATQVTTWYIGLIDNSPTPTLAAADTMSSHAGWTECTAYAEANRVAWPEDAASSQSMTNSTQATFSINATKTIYGFFITSSNTKSGTTGTLWSTAAFSSLASVVNSDTLRVTYTITD